MENVKVSKGWRLGQFWFIVGIMAALWIIGAVALNWMY